MLASKIVEDDCLVLMERYSGLFNQLSGSQILITGAAGFLGSYFLDIFAHHNLKNPSNAINVLATDNFLSGVQDRLKAFQGITGITLRQHNVLNALEVDFAFDYIIHAASIASPIYYRKYPLETIDVNVNGTWNMLRRATTDKAKAILYFSSSEIYGDPDPARIPTDESYLGNVSCLGPRACYDESKRLGETLAYNYHRQFGTPVKIVRPFNVYGPGQNLNDQRILPDLMAASVEERDIVLYSDGKPSRSFCYVRDFFAGTLNVMLKGSPAEAYNIGNDEEITIKETARLMCEVALENGKNIDVTFKKSADSDYLVDNPNRRCPDLTKARAEFDWAPEVLLREGLSRTLRSYLENIENAERNR